MVLVISAGGRLRETEADAIEISGSQLRLYRRNAGHKTLVGAFDSWYFAFPRSNRQLPNAESCAELLDLALKDCDPDQWPRLRYLVMQVTDAIRASREARGLNEDAKPKAVTK